MIVTVHNGVQTSFVIRMSERDSIADLFDQIRKRIQAHNPLALVVNAVLYTQQSNALLYQLNSRQIRVHIIQTLQRNTIIAQPKPIQKVLQRWEEIQNQAF